MVSELCHKKAGLRCFGPGLTQIGLFSPEEG